VKESVLGGLHEGFAVRVVPDGIRAVNVQPTDGDQALQAMREAGAQLI
jgi:nicotinamidase/pyrazinamidase